MTLRMACVLTGTLHLHLADQHLMLVAGDAVEFDTRTPHGYLKPGPTPTELLTCSADTANAYAPERRTAPRRSPRDLTDQRSPDGVRAAVGLERCLHRAGSPVPWNTGQAAEPVHAHGSGAGPAGRAPPVGTDRRMEVFRGAEVEPGTLRGQRRSGARGQVSPTRGTSQPSARGHL
jgi:hypothetical protein